MPVSYNYKTLIKYLLEYLSVMVLMMVTGGSGFAILIPIVFFAAFTNKSESMFFWLLTVVFAIMGNDFFLPKNAVFLVSHRVIMLFLGIVMTAKIFGERAPSPMIKPFLLMMLYGFFMIIPSFTGWCPLVSFLKLFLFFIVYLAYFGIAKSAGEAPCELSSKMRSSFLAFACIFIFGSILLIPFPEISQLKQEQYIDAVKSGADVVSLFKGMTRHSQSLGPCISAISVFLFADLLFSIRHRDWLYLSLLACCPYLIYSTSSRTGMLSYLLGMGFVLWQFAKARGIARRWRGKAISNSLMIIAVGLTCLLAVAGTRGIKGFLLKWNVNKTEVTVENMMSSRQALVDESIENFKKSPLLGNGFQVAERMKGTQFNGLVSILSAPIEKGVWITAVLEEGGVVGFVLIIIVFCGMIFVASKRGASIASSCAFLLLLTNLGEFTMFSLSYTGSILWAMVFAGLVFDIQRQRSRDILPVGNPRRSGV